MVVGSDSSVVVDGVWFVGGGVGRRKKLQWARESIVLVVVVVDVVVLDAF